MSVNIPLIDLKRQYKKVEKGLMPKLREILSEQKLILGKYCAELEKAIADFSGVPYALTCANGTDALILALMALGIKRGDEVITTPYTFFSTASSIALVGATPVFVDIKGEDMNIDPDLIERAITPKTRAIIVVHLFGKLCDMDRVRAIAGKHGLAVVEDMAQSLGARRNNIASGAFGDIAAVSFYPTKNLGGIGEGGMVLTQRADLFGRARKLRVHGMGDQAYHHEMIGINSRLDEIKACALAEKFPYLEGWNRKRIENATVLQPEAARPAGPAPRHRRQRRPYLSSVRDKGGAEGRAQGVPAEKGRPDAASTTPCPSTSRTASLTWATKRAISGKPSSRRSPVLPFLIYPELKKIEKDYVIASIREFFGGGAA